jgi:hypothetical protein
MPRTLLFLLLLGATGCSTIVYRAGQPTVIGDLLPGTPDSIVITNEEGQRFRIRRATVMATRLGGQRTVLWSPLTFYGIFIMAPLGLLQWAGESDKLAAIDGERSELLDVPDEEEVDPSAGGQL